MNSYYSPDGNLEVWNDKPKGYLTPEEYEALYPVYYLKSGGSGRCAPNNNFPESAALGYPPSIFHDIEDGKWVYSEQRYEELLTKRSEELKEKVHREMVRVKNSGVILEGVLFDSDPTAQVAYLNLKYEFNELTEIVGKSWQASRGQWVIMDASLLKKVMNAVSDHIAQCILWEQKKVTEVERAAQSGFDELNLLSLKFHNN